MFEIEQNTNQHQNLTGLYHVCSRRQGISRYDIDCHWSYLRLTLILVLLNFDIGAENFTFIRTKLHLKLILFQANQAPL